MAKIGGGGGRGGGMGGGNFFKAVPRGRTIGINPFSSKGEGGISKKLSRSQARYINSQMRTKIAPLVRQYRKLRANPQADSSQVMRLFNRIKGVAADIGTAASKK